MRQLRDDTHLILDGEVRVYRRERSKRWQAAFVIDGCLSPLELCQYILAKGVRKHGSEAIF